MKSLYNYLNESHNFLVKNHIIKGQTNVCKEITKNQLTDILKKWVLVMYTYDYVEDGITTKEIFIFKTSDNQKACGQDPGTLSGGVDKEAKKEVESKFKAITSYDIKEYGDKYNHKVSIECYYYKDLLNFTTNKVKIYDCIY